MIKLKAHTYRTSSDDKRNNNDKDLSMTQMNSLLNNGVVYSCNDSSNSRHLVEQLFRASAWQLPVLANNFQVTHVSVR